MSYFNKISLGMLFNQGYLSPTTVLDLMEQSDESTKIGLDKKTQPSSLPASTGPLIACCKA